MFPSSVDPGTAPTKWYINFQSGVLLKKLLSNYFPKAKLFSSDQIIFNYCCQILSKGYIMKYLLKIKTTLNYDISVNING